MRYLNALLRTAAADILSLFIAVTLAGSSAIFIRVISAVCTVGILVCVLGAFGAKAASDDLKGARPAAKKLSPARLAGMGAASAAIPLASWIFLLCTAGGSIDFYRWYKLINGWGLQLFNLLNSSASSDSLTAPEIWLMLPISAAPAIVLVSAYCITYRYITNNNI